MLQHVSIEIPPAEKERALEFWRLVGFEPVQAPEPIAEFVDWVERDGTQIHFIYTDGAVAPSLGHSAIVAPDFEATIRALSGAGFEVEEAERLWDERRAFAIAPGGHRVELMAAPPPPKTA